jgi:DNA-binding MarR family transcriptional regulator
MTIESLDPPEPLDDTIESSADRAGPVAAPAELDPVIHVPARLRLMATLAGLKQGDSLTFTRLQEILGLTPGNLITHLRKLEEVGYVTSSKAVIKLVPQTTVALTNRGHAALDAYREALRALLGGL